jgi:hypothetical protein
MLYTPWPRNILTSSRLTASAASRLGDNFSFGTLKNDFAGLIYSVIQVLPPERKHTLLLDLKFSKNSGMIM